MASAMTELETALRTSLLNLLRDRARGLDKSVDVDCAVADVLAGVYRTVADFAAESNLTRPAGLWNRLPTELRLATARCLAPVDRAIMLRVSQDVRTLLLSDTSLWTSVALPNEHISTAARAAFLRDMLARSGDRPLDVDWRMARSYASGSLDALSVALLRAVPRARTLAIEAMYLGPDADAIWARPMPHLEQLVVTDELSPDTSNISPESWSGAKAPLLRDVRLRETFLTGAPRDPFHNVVNFEAVVPYSARARDWDALWHWFPRLERLVLRVLSSDPPALPPPPDSLRRVVLCGSDSCPAPVILVRNWAVHRVELLEIFSDAESALGQAVMYMKACAPEPWSASFVPACCPAHQSRGKGVLRAENTTTIVWTRTVRELGAQLCEARANTRLVSRLRELTLGCLGALHGAFAFANLRALTIVDSSGDIACALDPHLPTRIEAPKLARLVIDLTSAPRPQETLALVPQFIACIMVLNSEQLQELVVLLPDSLDRQSPESADIKETLSATVRSVSLDYIPAAVVHDESCPRARAHGQ